VTVTDNGVGLSTEQLAQMFGEGVQFNPNQLQAGQGSGLGLYISRGLAVQHGGTLTAASTGLGHGSVSTLQLPLYRRTLPTTVQLALHRREPAQAGSRVSFSLPAREDEDGLPTLRSETKSPSSGYTNRRYSNCHRVLVVDDAISNRKMLVRLLKSRGYACEQAENGQQAVDMYRDFCERNVQVETVVMDYEMPVMNGPTATRALRELGCDALIVGVTGNLLPEDVRFFKQHGADAVLGKPLDIRAFEELVVDLRDGAEHMPSWDRTPQGCVEKRPENPHQEYCASRDNTRNVSVMLEPQFGEHEVHGIAGTGALDYV
jgi:CheY-like chemotaxis protein